MKYKIVYDKRTNLIIESIPDEQDIEVYYFHYEEEFKSNLGVLKVDFIPTNLDLYKIENNILIKKSVQEIQELKRYKRLLTDEERLLEKIKPSQEEIKKAEITIEILSILEEVL